MSKRIGGILPALLTPMNEDGTAINYTTLRQLVDYLIQRGVSGFFVCGGTGEGLLLTVEERRRILETVVEQVAGRVSVVAHIGALATQTAQELAQHAAELDVDAVAAVPPVYFRVDRPALLDHYRLIAEAAAGTPVYVYNIPSATGVEINVDVMAELLQVSAVSGIKYTSQNLYDMRRITELDADVTVLSGFDEICVAGLSMGAHGAIGSTYNLMPATFTALYQASQSGDWERARVLQGRANQVITALLSVPLVAGMKAILTDWGYACGAPRRPQRPLTADERASLLEAITAVGLRQMEEESLAALAGEAAVADQSPIADGR